MSGYADEAAAGFERSRAVSMRWWRSWPTRSAPRSLMPSWRNG
jgi:hypothetical protein